MSIKNNKLIPILIFIVSLEIFFLFNGFTSTAFWYQLGRFGLSYKSTFLLYFGTLSWIFFLISIMSVAYIMYNKILRMKIFIKLTIIAFYLGGFGFWLSGFIPVFKARTDLATIWCLPNTQFCIGLPPNLFAPFVYANIIICVVLIYVLLKKDKIY